MNLEPREKSTRSVFFSPQNVMHLNRGEQFEFTRIQKKQNYTIFERN